MRLFPLFAFIVLALALSAMLLQKQEAAPTDGPRNEPMPAMTLTTMDGSKTWDATALKGQVTLINFFASWCTPCEAEMPELAAFKKQFPALRIEGIAWNDTPKTLAAWLKKHGNPFRALWLDKNGEATIALGVRGIPETLVVDREGIIRYRIAGPLTAEMREGNLGALLTQLLREATHEK